MGTNDPLPLFGPRARTLRPSRQPPLGYMLFVDGSKLRVFLFVPTTRVFYVYKFLTNTPSQVVAAA